jgi:hypothetical protein
MLKERRIACVKRRTEIGTDAGIVDNGVDIGDFVRGG